MKVSLAWIKDYVALPADLDMAKLAYDLTMTTVEVEAVDDLAERFAGMVVGVVTEIKPHPNADKLTLCQTDLGGESREIVCGGSNLAVGMQVAVAPPGAFVRWHGEGELVELKITKIRGVESYGMICASSEIGLFDLFPFEEEATIVDLSAFDAPAGTPLAEALGLNDIILEIDNKSLTNRPDLWGHYGIAREISALYGLPLAPIKPYAPPETKGFTVAIADVSRCRRYIGTQIEGLAVIPAPFAIQSRLWRVGQRPINAIVDITNYVMLATGQPTHAFDADVIVGHITVRLAGAGEKLLLLNDKELTLTKEDLVIADDAEAVGLAGVMGGQKDSVLPTTDKVILEVANFEAIGVRHTATRHETRTDAAARYEKAIDPERCDLAVALAMQLFNEVYPHCKVTGYCDNYPTKIARSEITVSLDWLNRRLGKTIPPVEIERMLAALGFETSLKNDTMHIVTPSWRSTGDISLPDDIMEEVARLHGFENFAATPIVTSLTSAVNQPAIDLERNIKEYLAFRSGLREIFTYPWMSDEFAAPFLPADDQRTLVLANPPSPTERLLRSTLLPNLCQAVAGNRRYYDEFAIFEGAQALWGEGYAKPYDERESLPTQRRHIAGAFVAGRDKVNELFRRAKGVIELLPRYTHIEPFAFTKENKPGWADEAVWLNVKQGDEKVGELALLSTPSALQCGIKNCAVMLFELDIDALKILPSRTNRFTHIPEYPLADYDVSLLVARDLPWERIESVITEKINADSFIRGVSFVDEYRGKQIPEDKKSVTLRLVVGSTTKTLTAEEIESSVNGVVKRLGKTLGAEMR
jgi:phenylalanyl-tRNA synthetase beta chain